uniref:Uncharacterized protein n=1 Tax=Streptomyces sp. NBC_00003 TaxID=2903608 RepID=A0AAU2VFX6_9ACTN
MNTTLKATFISGVLAITAVSAAGAAHADEPTPAITTVKPAAAPVKGAPCRTSLSRSLVMVRSALLISARQGDAC